MHDAMNASASVYESREMVSWGNRRAQEMVEIRR